METPENTNNPLNQHRPNNRQGLFILTKKHEKAGRVFLVGAGPGDPGLITIAALRRLRTGRGDALTVRLPLCWPAGPVHQRG